MSNPLLSWCSLRLGPAFYGYGFALSMGLTGLVGLVWLDRSFRRLLQDTFMRQAVA